MRLDVILRITTKILLPFMLIFALYVHFHGEYSPGGGFQAGVIIAAAVVFHALMFGLRQTKLIVPPWLVETMTALGVIIYAVTGLYSMMLGDNYLDYDQFGATHSIGQVRGIIAVEVGVLMTVTGSMVVLFYAFAGRGIEAKKGRK